MPVEATPLAPAAPQPLHKPFSEWAAANRSGDAPTQPEDYRAYGDYVRDAYLGAGAYSPQVEQGLQDELKATVTAKLGVAPEDIDDLLTAPRAKTTAERAALVRQAGVAGGATDVLSRYDAYQKEVSARGEAASPSLKETLAALEAEAATALDQPGLEDAAKRKLLQRGEAAFATVLEPALDPNEPASKRVLVGTLDTTQDPQAQIRAAIKAGLLEPEDAASALMLLQTPAGETRPLYRQQQLQDAYGDLEALAGGEDADPELRVLLDELTKSKLHEEAGPDYIEEIGQAVMDFAIKPFGAARAVLQGVGIEDTYAPPRPSAEVADELLAALRAKGVGSEAAADLEDLSAAAELAADRRVMGDRRKPFYDAEEGLGKNIVVGAAGVPLIHPALLANKALFDQALAEREDLSDLQKSRLQAIRAADREANYAQRSLLLAGDAQVGGKWLKAKQAGLAEGKTGPDVLDEFLSDKNNFDVFTARLEGVGASIADGFGGFVAAIPAVMLDAKWAQDYLTGTAKANAQRKSVAQAFGVDLGLGQDVAEAVAPMVVDLGATALLNYATGGVAGTAVAAARSEAQFTAKGAAKALTGNLLRTTGLESAEALASKQAIQQLFRAGSSQVDITDAIQVFNKAAQSQFAVKAPMFLPAANRALGAQYASVYNALPDSMSHEEKHDTATGSALLASAATGAITTAFSMFGAGGLEDVLLAKATGRQLKDVLARVAGVDDISDAVFKKAVQDRVKATIKQYGLSAPAAVGQVGQKAAEEFAEEGLDEFVNTFITDEALQSDTPLIERLQQAWQAGAVGAVLGGGVPVAASAAKNVRSTALGQPTDVERGAMRRFEDEFISGVAENLQSSGAPMTAQVVGQLLRAGGGRIRTAQGQQTRQGAIAAAQAAQAAQATQATQAVGAEGTTTPPLEADVLAAEARAAGATTAQAAWTPEDDAAYTALQAAVESAPEGAVVEATTGRASTGDRAVDAQAIQAAVDPSLRSQRSRKAPKPAPATFVKPKFTTAKVAKALGNAPAEAFLKALASKGIVFHAQPSLEDLGKKGSALGLDPAGVGPRTEVWSGIGSDGNQHLLLNEDAFKLTRKDALGVVQEEAFKAAHRVAAQTLDPSLLAAADQDARGTGLGPLLTQVAAGGVVTRDLSPAVREHALWFAKYLQDAGFTKAAPYFEQAATTLRQKADPVGSIPPIQRAAGGPQPMRLADAAYTEKIPKATLLGKTAREALLLVPADNPLYPLAQELARQPFAKLDFDLFRASRSPRAARGRGYIKLPPAGMSAKTLIHEIGHTMTADIIDTYVGVSLGKGAEHNAQLQKALDNAATPEPIKRLIKLYRSTLSQQGLLERYLGPKGIANANPDRTTKAGGDYGLANMDEFVAQAWSDPKFQDMLRGLEGDQRRSLWTEFVDIIKALLNVPPANTNMLESVLDVTVELAAGKVLPPATTVIADDVIVGGGGPEADPAAALAAAQAAQADRLEAQAFIVGSGVLPPEIPLVASGASEAPMWESNGVVYYNPSVLMAILRQEPAKARAALEDIVGAVTSEEMLHVASRRALGAEEFQRFVDGLREADFEETLVAYTEGSTANEARLRAALASDDAQVVARTKAELAEERLRQHAQQLLYGTTTEATVAFYRATPGARQAALSYFKAMAQRLLLPRRLRAFKPAERVLLSKVIHEAKMLRAGYRPAPEDGGLFTPDRPNDNLAALAKAFGAAPESTPSAQDEAYLKDAALGDHNGTDPLVAGVPLEEWAARNPEAAARMAARVASAAQGAGFTEEAYHGTPTGGFTEFRKDYRGRSGGQSRGGFSFTTDRGAAEGYASGFSDEVVALDEALRVANAALASTTNPEQVSAYFTGLGYDGIPEFYWGAIDDNNEFADSLRSFAEDLTVVDSSLAGALSKAATLLDRGADVLPEVKKVFLRIPPEAPTFKATPETLGLAVANLDVQNVPGGAARVAMPDGNYVLYVAEPSQIKSADYATFDDAGALVPLTERFQTDNEDIRFTSWGVASELPAGLADQATDYSSLLEAVFRVPLFHVGPYEAPQGRFLQETKGAYDPRFQRLLDQNTAFQKTIATLTEDLHRRALAAARSAGGASAELAALLNEASGSSAPLLTGDQTKALDDTLDAALAGARDWATHDAEEVEANQKYFQSKAGGGLKDPDKAKRKAHQTIQKQLEFEAFQAHREEQAVLREAARATAKEQRDLALGRLAAQSPELARLVVDTRVLVDEMSRSARKHFDDNPALQATFDANLGLYLTRSYRFFEEADFQTALLDPANPQYEPLRQEAVKFFEEVWVKDQAPKLLKKNPTWSPAEADAEARRLLAAPTAGRAASLGQEALWEYLQGLTRPGAGVQVESKLLKVLQKNLKQKKDVPAALRALLGEQDDAATGFNSLLRSLSVSAALAGSLQRNENIRTVGVENGWLLTPAEWAAKPAAERGDFAQIVPDGTSGLTNPLAGLYAPVELISALREDEALAARDKQVLAAQDVVSRVTRGMAQATGMSMALNTLGSIGYYSRNIVGKSFDALAQGRPQLLLELPKSVWQETKIFASGGEVMTPEQAAAQAEMQGRSLPARLVNEIKTLATGAAVLTPEQDAYRRKLQGLSVIKDGVRPQVLRDLLQPGGTTPAQVETELEGVWAAVEAAGGRVAKGKEWLLRKLLDAEDLVDSFYRIALYEDTLATLQAARAEGSGELEGRALRDFDDVALEQEAARIVLATTPSHSQTMPVVSKFTKSGLGLLVAPFFRFRTEMIRTPINTFQLARAEMASGNSVLEKRGRERLAGVLGVLGLSATLPLMLSKLLAGVGGEEDDALRKGMPSYLRNNSFFYFRWGQDRALQSLDLTYVNPYSVLADPVARALGKTFAGKPAEGAVQALVTLVFDPFLDDQIFAGAVRALTENKDPATDKPIWEPGIDGAGAAWKAAKFLAHEAFTPRVLADAMKAFQAAEGDPSRFNDNPAMILINGALPARVYPIDVEGSLRRYLFESKQQFDRVAQSINRAKSPAPLSPEDVRQLYYDRLEGKKKINEDLYKTIYGGYVGLGLTPQAIDRVFDDMSFGDNRRKLLRMGLMDRDVLTPDFRQTLRAKGEWGVQRMALIDEAIAKTPRMIVLD